jgi:hypothetical protein
MFDDEFEEYCLENTLNMLKKKFTSDNILIIRPARTQGDFSFFDNLLTPGHAILQMSKLLESYREEAQKQRGIVHTHNLLTFSDPNSERSSARSYCLQPRYFI